jgi:hypothetical protein
MLSDTPVCGVPWVRVVISERDAMRKNRRMLAILVLLIVATSGSVCFAASAGNLPQYATVRYMLTIGKEQQNVAALQGGSALGTVTEIKLPGGPVKKHVSGITFDPINVRILPTYFTPFISGSLDEKLGAVSGSIWYFDGNGKPVLRRDIRDMVLTELAFPHLHGWGPAPADLELVMTMRPAETILALPAADEVAPTPTALSPVRAKPWRGAWRLTIPDIDTQNVSYIEPFTIRRKFVTQDLGEQRVQTILSGPGPWEIPNIAFYLPPWLGTQVVAWHENFVIKGNNGDDQEKTLVIELLDNELKTPILRLEGSGVGIVSAKYEQDIAPNAASTSGYRVELYVESLKIVDPTAATATSKKRMMLDDFVPPR